MEVNRPNILANSSLATASIPEKRTVKQMHAELYSLLEKANAMSMDVCSKLDSSRLHSDIQGSLSDGMCLVNSLDDEIIYARHICDTLYAIMEILGD